MGMQGDKGVQKMINRDLLQQFDEDDLYVGYNPAMPMKIFGYELE